MVHAPILQNYDIFGRNAEEIKENSYGDIYSQNESLTDFPVKVGVFQAFRFGNKDKVKRQISAFICWIMMRAVARHDHAPHEHEAFTKKKGIMLQ